MQIAGLMAFRYRAVQNQMAYMVKVNKLTEDEAFVKYAYHGSGWDVGRDIGEFKIYKITGDIIVSEIENTIGEIVERSIWAVVKRWRQDGNYPDEAIWAS